MPIISDAIRIQGFWNNEWLEIDGSFGSATIVRTAQKGISFMSRDNNIRRPREAIMNVASLELELTRRFCEATGGEPITKAYEMVSRLLNTPKTKVVSVIDEYRADEELHGNDLFCWRVANTYLNATMHGVTSFVNLLTIGSIHVEDYLDTVPKVLWLVSRQAKKDIRWASSWYSSTVVSLAEAITISRDFSRLPILADALEEAGCTDETLLSICRESEWFPPYMYFLNVLRTGGKALKGR